jgi:Tfp pilus assembly protein PilN
MGLFWDLIQQSQISQQRDSTESLEERIAALESELHEVQRIQLILLQILEEHSQRDLDSDGRIG